VVIPVFQYLAFGDRKMKKLKVTILIRIRIDGKQRYVPPVWHTKTVLKPGWAFAAPSYALRYL